MLTPTFGMLSSTWLLWIVIVGCCFVLFTPVTTAGAFVIHHHSLQQHQQQQQQQYKHHPWPTTTLFQRQPRRERDMILQHTNRNTILCQSSSSSSSSSSKSDSEIVVETTIPQQQQQQQQQQQELLQDAVQELKQVLLEEYTSMFNPMRREFYASNVTFDDPLTRLQGVDAYQRNVDLLGSRTWLGAILFDNANIVLHSIEGGHVTASTSTTTTATTTTTGAGPFQISDITTRWTLSMTFQALPWRPTARFTGISVYQVEPRLDNLVKYDQQQQQRQKEPLVRILRQQDYWDSINLIKGGQYQKVDPLLGLQDLLQQFLTIPSISDAVRWWWSPPPHVENNNYVPPSQLPFQLLRRAKTYQIRRYPSYDALVVDTNKQGGDDQVPLTKKVLQSSLEEQSIGNKKAPILSKFNKKGEVIASWLLLPQSVPAVVVDSQQSNGPNGILREQPQQQQQSQVIDYRRVIVPSQVVAVAECADRLHNVADVHLKLRETLRYDGITIDDKNDDLQVRDDDDDVRVDGQWTTTKNYNHYYYLEHEGRGEVWIPLLDGCHPW